MRLLLSETLTSKSCFYKPLMQAVQIYIASVVRQLEVYLFKVARARVTLARMSLAFVDQINGFGLALCTERYSLMAAFVARFYPPAIPL